jgi:hypothetical protein
MPASPTFHPWKEMDPANDEVLKSRNYKFNMPSLETNIIK